MSARRIVWDFQVFSQTFFELRFSLGNEGQDGKNLNSQTWPGTPRHLVALWLAILRFAAAWRP